MRRSFSIFFYIVFSGISFFPLLVNGQEPDVVSKKIIAFCLENKGKKVGNGECWTLAEIALNKAGATWSPPYGFGKQLDKAAFIQPGDILQFEKVVLEYPDGRRTELAHHTAIVYSIISSSKFIIAEQNVNGKKLLFFTEIDLKYIKKGRYTVYRPQ